MLRVLKNIFFFALCLYIEVASIIAQPQIKWTLTEQDKLQIIESVIQHKLFISSSDRSLLVREPSEISKELCKQGKEILEKYLVSDDINAGALPQIPCANLVFLTEKELVEKKALGLYYFRFDKFEIKGKKVLIKFSSNYENSKLWVFSGRQYEYQKKAGQWFGKITGTYGGRACQYRYKTF